MSVYVVIVLGSGSEFFDIEGVFQDVRDADYAAYRINKAGKHEAEVYEVEVQ